MNVILVYAYNKRTPAGVITRFGRMLYKIKGERITIGELYETEVYIRKQILGNSCEVTIINVIPLGKGTE